MSDHCKKCNFPIDSDTEEYCGDCLKEQKTFTRKQYMNKECTHRQFYSQFVNEATMRYVANHIGWERIVNSNCEHFNDIPLIEWDRLGRLTIEGCSSLANGICVHKEAAKQIKELNTLS